MMDEKPALSAIMACSKHPPWSRFSATGTDAFRASFPHIWANKGISGFTLKITSRIRGARFSSATSIAALAVSSLHIFGATTPYLPSLDFFKISHILTNIINSSVLRGRERDADSGIPYLSHNKCRLTQYPGMRQQDRPPA